MRRLTPLLLLVGLTGCTGFGEFVDHAFSLPGADPNIPMADSENVRRALGLSPEIRPLETEPGNVWPGPERPEPTLADIENNPGRENERGFPPTSVPGARPGLPDHGQPRPRGSSTPPGSNQPNLPAVPPPGVLPPPPTSLAPRPAPSVVPTPEGPAIDSGGTRSYRELTTPRGPGAIVVPNGNGTSTVINPDGTVQTIPTPR